MPSMKSGRQTLPASPNALKAFFLASRPKTWIASFSPVLIGASMAPQIDGTIFFLTLLFSFLIQVGTNFANDYFDFINGADSHLRNGPKRATLEGWISPNAMRMATIIVFAASIAAAIPLMIIAGLWSLFLAASCVAFGIFYTGGPKPLGYLGLGEVLVLIFFGPVAACGAYFLQTNSLTLPVIIASLAPGLLSCSLLVANNLRDEKSDRLTGKNTLVARFGRAFGSWEYTACLVLSALIPLILIAFFKAPLGIISASFILPAATPLIKKTFRFRDPLELISVLQGSSLLLLFYTILFSATFLLGTST